MTSFKITVIKVEPSNTPDPSPANEQVFSQTLPETDFDLKRFVRDLNAVPRKRRKSAKTDATNAG